jgi:hypothetical protein
MKLRPENARIEIAGEEVVQALREIELVLVSLHRIGAYYAIAPDAEKASYERETTRFIDEWGVTARLAKVRALLSQRFDRTLGEDDMGDLERELEAIEGWTSPTSTPPSREERERHDP